MMIIIVNKKENLLNSGLCHPGRQWVKLKDSEKRDISGPCKRAEEAMEHEGDGDTNYGWCIWNNRQRIGKETGRLRNMRSSRDQQDYSITKISQKIEKIPGDMRKLDQTPVKNHQLMLVWKTFKGVK